MVSVRTGFREVEGVVGEWRGVRGGEGRGWVGCIGSASKGERGRGLRGSIGGAGGVVIIGVAGVAGGGRGGGGEGGVPRSMLISPVWGRGVGRGVWKGEAAIISSSEEPWGAMMGACIEVARSRSVWRL